MPESVGSTVIESNTVIRIANQTVNRIGTNRDIVRCKTPYKNRLISRAWPLVAQVISNRLAGRER